MTLPRTIPAIFIVALLSFFFPRIESSGSGPISIRGSAPYERTIKIRFGLLKKEWASATFEDEYDGSIHSSHAWGTMQTSRNWWFGLVALMSGIAYYVLRQQDR